MASKQGSRWGSFLQQAVAGVESRLDNILADGPEEKSDSHLTDKAATVLFSGATSQQENSVSKTTSSINKTNDRLQERLARAIATRNVGSKGESLPSSLSSSSSATRLEEPRLSSRTSLDIISVDTGNTSSNYDQAFKAISSLKDHEYTDKSCLQSMEIEAEKIQEANVEQIKSSNQRRKLSSGFISGPSKQPEDSVDEFFIQKPQSDLSTTEALRNEDIHDYIEKIDALQCKLQYLAKESAERAQIASAAAPSGSLEKKLADKDLQVALLLEEGQSLSKKEFNYLATIKKLRIQIKEESKEALEAKIKQEAAKQEAILAIERCSKMQEFEKQVGEQQKLIIQLKNDIKSIQSENETQKSIITNLRSRLEGSTLHDRKEDIGRIHESLQTEQKRVIELEDEIAKIEMEKKLEVDRAQNQIEELKGIIDANEERARATKLEMKTEQQLLESKLESMRARAEEVTSGVTSDAQARLLRQIETLQTQYSVANENWHGIEASLVARVMNTEKERDEAICKENDNRSKFRDATLKARQLEKDLKDLQSSISDSQRELSDYKSKFVMFQKRAEEAELALEENRKAFDHEREALRIDQQNRLVEEKQKLLEEISNSNQISQNRGDIPLLSSRKSSTGEYLGQQNNQFRRTSTRSITYETTATPSNLFNHRTSIQTLRLPLGHGTLSPKGSKTSLKEDPENSFPQNDLDDFFEDGILSPPPHQNMNEITSEYTAGAGPSVQLVERMSSAVRRLKCEKVAMKEDIGRLSAQREEARAEIVNLIQQVEAKKISDKKIVELENELNKVKERYETTLLMLGEKSEEVDELRGDIQDIKSMYRDLVERTV